MQSIPDNLPSKADFLRIKRAMYANYVRTFDSTESLAMALTDNFVNGTDLMTEGELIASMTYEEFAKFASAYFTDKEFALSVIYPTDEESEENE